jgi:glycosyltransferase involved in cell wall biosynthesis
MHIAIVTAGGAGMFCGSCLHDNTWARALMAEGAEVSLIPTYTPIRVDAEDHSVGRIFFGGINVYMNSRFRFWRFLPPALTRWLDGPRIIRWATGCSVSNDAHRLGDLAISMLRGREGPHRHAAEELAEYLARDLKPDVVIFSNALLSGALYAIKERLDVPVLCTLQGDDIFLDSLPEVYREPAVDLISERASQFDGFLVHSEFYRGYISRYLRLDPDRFSLLPLGIDVERHSGLPESKQNEAFTVGYFARIAPEKGLHHLAEAFVLLKEAIPEARLRIGGFLGKQDRDYFRESLSGLRPFGDSVEYIGSPDSLGEKVEFLNTLDVLSVPTDFLEPKGLYVLEALANGVPVVQPAHGAFPEVIERTGGGVLVTPRDPAALAEGLASLADESVRLGYARSGWEGVRAHYSSRMMSQRTLEILRTFTEPAAEPCLSSPRREAPVDR